MNAKIRHNTPHRPLRVFDSLKGFSYAVLAMIGMLYPPASWGQAPNGITGQLWVTCAGNAIVFLNGKECLKGGTGAFKSEPLTVRPGDRLLIQLKKTGNGKPAFLSCVISEDQAIVASFRNRDFKVITDVSITDFTLQDFAKLKKFATGVPIEMRRKWQLTELPVKNYSEWIWGDANDCTIGCIVTDQMFKKKPR